MGDLTALAPRARVRGRRSVARVAQWVTTTSYLQRWLVLGGAIGLIAGAAAIAFYSLLVWFTHLFLTDLVGRGIHLSAVTSDVPPGSEHFLDRRLRHRATAPLTRACFSP